MEKLIQTLHRYGYEGTYFKKESLLKVVSKCDRTLGKAFEIVKGEEEDIYLLGDNYAGRKYGKCGTETLSLAALVNRIRYCISNRTNYYRAHTKEDLEYFLDNLHKGEENE